MPKQVPACDHKHCRHHKVMVSEGDPYFSYTEMDFGGGVVKYKTLSPQQAMHSVLNITHYSRYVYVTALGLRVTLCDECMGLIELALGN